MKARRGARLAGPRRRTTRLERARARRTVPAWIAALPLLALALAACAADGARRDPGTAGLPASDLERRVRLVDARAGTELSLDQAVARLARAEAVFFGETHVDETTHALELAVYEGLVRATGGRVVLAMEMFARDAQPALDLYLAGEIGEDEFLARAEPWSNYRTGYRPLIEAARAHGLPVVGSNLPADLRRRLSGGGALDELGPAERRLVPPEILPNSEAYWERFVRIVRGHPGQTTDPEDYLWSGQSLWDNTMGWSCAQALERNPGWLVYHVNGRFHTDHGQGTVDQLLLRRPETRVATITASAVEDVAGLEPAELADASDPDADVLAFVQARGRGLQEGHHAVRTGRTARFLLHLSPGASDAEPAPLLIWLTRDHVGASDELAYLELALGDELAVAVLEPPFRAPAPDLGPGGTWIHTETSSEDLADGLAAAREARRYLLAHYPLDPERVVLAGAGTGGTVAAAGALAGDFERAAAFEPARFRRLRLWGLPEPGGPRRELRVTTWGRGNDAGWWTDELAAYAPSGLEGELVEGAPRSVVRRALGLPAEADCYPSTLVCGNGEPWDFRLDTRHELWMGTLELALDAGLSAAPPDLGGLAERLAADEVSGRVLPVPDGPFGGTTLVVVPAEPEVAPEHVDSFRAAWLALDGSDVLEAHGRGYALRVAVQGGSPSPAEVLAGLRRSNVLVVPAEFCASPAQMFALQHELRSPLRDTTAAFLPGLGGRLHLADRR